MSSQPVLPAEIQFTEAELAFIEESPPNFFPDNQDSNFGFIIRKIWCDDIQDISDQQSIIFRENFPQSSTLLLDEWEEEYAVTQNPPLDIAQRRAIILALLRRGLFTRSMRDGIISSFIVATFGTPIEFTEFGIAFPSGGIPFASEAGNVNTLFAVSENFTNFSYAVRIKSTVTPNEYGLKAALDRLTPAGILWTLEYVYEPSIVINWNFETDVSAWVGYTNGATQPTFVRSTNAAFIQNGTGALSWTFQNTDTSAKTYMLYPNQNMPVLPGQQWYIRSYISSSVAGLLLGVRSDDGTFRTITANAAEFQPLGLGLISTAANGKILEGIWTVPAGVYGAAIAVGGSVPASTTWTGAGDVFIMRPYTA